MDIAYYSNIINLPHHQSLTRRHMSLHDRAAQFAPFAALKGYEEAVIETGRLTDSKIILDENAIAILNKKLQKINDNLKHNNKAEITYFVKDKYKAGGSYVTKKVEIKQIDKIYRKIILNNKKEIDIDNIVEIKYKNMSI